MWVRNTHRAVAVRTDEAGNEGDENEGTDDKELYRAVQPRRRQPLSAARDLVVRDKLTVWNVGMAHPCMPSSVVSVEVAVMQSDNAWPANRQKRKRRVKMFLSLLDREWKNAPGPSFQMIGSSLRVVLSRPRRTSSAFGAGFAATWPGSAPVRDLVSSSADAERLTSSSIVWDEMVRMGSEGTVS